MRLILIFFTLPYLADITILRHVMMARTVKEAEIWIFWVKSVKKTGNNCTKSIL